MKSEFLGPGPGALIYVCLNFWENHYRTFKEFPYPQPIQKCFVVGEFVGFKYQGVTPYWHVHFKAFGEKMWVKEEFFMSDVWMTNTSSTTYLITNEQYTELELAVRVTDSDLDEDESGGDDAGNEENLEDEEEGPRAPKVVPPKKKAAKGTPKPRGQSKRRSNLSRNPQTASAQENDTDAEDGNEIETDDDDDIAAADDVPVSNQLEFKMPNEDQEPSKPLRELPAFIKGFPRNTDHSPLDAFREDTPEKIVEYFMEPRWRHQLRCMNERREREHPTYTAFTYGEVKTYHGILAYMGIVKLPNEGCYWDAGDLQVDGLALPNFDDIMKATRFRQFKECRHYYHEEDHDPNDAAWKVRRQFNLFKDLMEESLKYPGQNIAFDEAMMRCTSKKCPLRRVLPNKPISTGIKFWVLADKETGCTVRVYLDAGTETDFQMAIDYPPLDYYGKLVLRACVDLPGKHYILSADKLFMSPQLALNLLEYDIAAVGPCKVSKVAKYLEPGIRMSLAKKAKPTIANPRGKVTKGHTPDGKLHIFGFMDSSLVYFLSTYQGYTVNAPVYRNLPGGRQAYQAPSDINHYNKNMNAVDALDQCRTGHYNIEHRRTIKWTDQFIMGLYSWTLTQSFLIYRHFHKDDVTGRGHGAFQLQVATAFIFNKENREMHQKLSTKPVHAHRHSSSSSTPSIPMGNCHSMEDYPAGRGTDTRRKVRYACVVCPVDPTGSRGKTTTFCRECQVPVHHLCFGELHNNPNFAKIRREGHKETMRYLEGN